MVGRVVELLQALDLLSQSSGTTIKEIAQILDMDKRSVRRLLHLIEAIGIPLCDEEPDLGEKEKRWKLIDEYAAKLRRYHIIDLPLTPSEVVALYLLRGEARVGTGTVLHQRIDSAFKKISQLLPPGLFSQLDKISGLFVASAKFTKDYSGKEDVIDGCTQAMLKKQTCYVKYHSFSSDMIKSFKIDPLCFFEHNGGLYLFVRATSFGDIRILALERIHEITPTDAVFEWPEGFDPESLLDSAFDIVLDDPVEVKIWISADQARYVKERTWAKGQIITEQSDGSIILEMKTSGWWHVKKWVLGFGAEARALEPEELQKEIAEELERALVGYRSKTFQAP